MTNSTKKPVTTQLPLELRKKLAKASRLAYLLHRELNARDLSDLTGETHQNIAFHAKRADKEILHEK